MSVYVALLRGINVGGKNRLPMQGLRDILQSLSCTRISTYIQSGNAVFCSDAARTALASRIASGIEQQFGFRPGLQLLKAQEFASILSANPFPKAAATPRNLHVWFLAAAAKHADTASLRTLQADSEKFVLTAKALYLHAPDGIGRSKLAARVEASLGVAATARNWRTVSAIAAMAAAAKSA